MSAPICVIFHPANRFVQIQIPKCNLILVCSCKEMPMLIQPVGHFRRKCTVTFLDHGVCCCALLYRLADLSILKTLSYYITGYFPVLQRSNVQYAPERHVNISIDRSQRQVLIAVLVIYRFCVFFRAPYVHGVSPTFTAAQRVADSGHPIYYGRHA